MINLFVTWDVSPEMLKIGSLTLRFYGFFFILGFVIASFILKWMFKHSKIQTDQVDILIILGFFAAVVGGRLGHVFFYEPAYYLENPGKILKVWEGGVSSHGAGFMLFVVFAIYAAIKKWNLLWLIDRLVVPAALCSAFIRLGNLMNSEIYGYETSLPWGFVFVRNGETVPKHPTQIYESLFSLAVFVILILVYRKYKQDAPKGLLTGWFLTLYASSRFLVEFVKQPQVEFEHGMMLNMGQLLSIPFIITGITILFLAYRRKPVEPYQNLKKK